MVERIPYIVDVTYRAPGPNGARTTISVLLQIPAYSAHQRHEHPYKEWVLRELKLRNLLALNGRKLETWTGDFAPEPSGAAGRDRTSDSLLTRL